MLSIKKSGPGQFICALCIFLPLFLFGDTRSVSQSWVARYDGTAASTDEAIKIAVDGSGNSYVTGRSSESDRGFDCTTIQYDSSGTQQWRQRYDGPNSGTDRGYSLMLDGDSVLFVTGSSQGTGSCEIIIIKYTTSGTQRWVARDSVGAGYDVDVDGSGNVYVTGYTSGSDFVTIKYNSSGTQQWWVTYDGGYDDWALAITVDNSGNVYITGESEYYHGALLYTRIVTRKYNSSGTVQWTAYYQSNTGPCRPEDIVIDGSDNVYVTGYAYVSGNGMDYVTIKYNSSGTEQWAATTDGSESDHDGAKALAVDGSGNVYVVGGIDEGTPTHGDIGTVKYNSSGEEQWTSTYNGSANSADSGYDIVLDGSNNVYVTGVSRNSGSSGDYTTIKYNSSGTQQWAITYDGTGNDYDEAKSIDIDDDGNVYVTGLSKGQAGLTGGNNDYATVKYTQSKLDQSPGKHGQNILQVRSSLTNQAKIYYTLQDKSDVSISIYNCMGLRVKTLVKRVKEKGTYVTSWNGRDDSGRDAPSGTYFVHLKGKNNSATEKIVLLK